MDTCRGRLILHPLTQRCYCPRSKRSKGSLRGHIGMRPRPLRFQHPDKPRCNISGPGLLHKDKGYARTLSSLDLPFASSTSSVFISLSLDRGTCTASPFPAFGFPNLATRSVQAFLYDSPRAREKGVQGATLSRREDAQEAIWKHF